MVGIWSNSKTKDLRPKTKLRLMSVTTNSLSARKRVLSRHLFAPVHDEVGVVERTGFNVGSFGGGLNVLADRVAGRSVLRLLL